MAPGCSYSSPAPGRPEPTCLPGEYRLRLTYRRDNTAADTESLVLSQAGDATDETAWIDMPWSISS